MFVIWRFWCCRCFLYVTDTLKANLCKSSTLSLPAVQIWLLGKASLEKHRQNVIVLEMRASFVLVCYVHMAWGVVSSLCALFTISFPFDAYLTAYKWKISLILTIVKIHQRSYFEAPEEKCIILYLSSMVTYSMQNSCRGAVSHTRDQPRHLSHAQHAPTVHCFFANMAPDGFTNS